MFWPQGQCADCEDLEPHMLNALSYCAINPADFETFMEEKKVTAPKEIVPPQHHHFLHVFAYEDLKRLPPVRPGLDHEIKLVHNDHDGFPIRRLMA